ncbi:MAG: bis(5'-nucleosyl)-tetraphosphatase [Christensenellales bacterium]
MYLGRDVSASLLGRVEGTNSAESLYCARIDGLEAVSAVAYKPGEDTEGIKGRVIATFKAKNGEHTCFIAPYGVEKYLPDIVALFPRASDITCLFEKSCGAVVFMGRGSERIYLLIENRRHNWGFPKGHVEPGENEHDTAAREIHEETGLTPAFVDGFRQTVSYYVKDTVRKTAVYFVAETHSDNVRIPAGEISSYRFAPLRDALFQLTYKSEKSLLLKADSFLQSKDY